MHPRPLSLKAPPLQELAAEPRVREALRILYSGSTSVTPPPLSLQELAAEPRVREALRILDSGSASVTTQPTTAGEGHPSMEPWSKYGRVKRLSNKPLLAFGGSDQFLRIQVRGRGMGGRGHPDAG